MKRHRIQSRVDEELYTKIESYLESDGVSESELVRKALKFYFKHNLTIDKKLNNLTEQIEQLTDKLENFEKRLDKIEEK